MNDIWKIKLFIVSNIPVFILVLITRFSFHKLNWSYFIKEGFSVYLSIFGIIYSLIILYKLYKKVNLTANGTRENIQVENMNESYLVTLTSYILPLFSLLVSGIRGELSFVFILIVAMILFVKSDNYYSSFAFFLMRYNIYLASTSTEKFILLSKKSINELNNKSINVRYFDDVEVTKRKTVTKIVIEKGVKNEK